MAYWWLYILNCSEGYREPRYNSLKSVAALAVPTDETVKRKNNGSYEYFMFDTSFCSFSS